MKNRKWLNTSMSLVAVMFVMSLFSGVAVAETPREQYEKAKEQYQIHKEKYNNAREKFTDARERYEAAKLKFKSSRNNISREELISFTKEYLEKAIDQMISHLEIMKYRVENSEKSQVLPFNAADNIDTHIAQLQDIRTKVQQATTPQELIDLHREVKDLWVKIRLETRYYIGILINHRIDAFLSKADDVSVKMDAAIQKLEDQGKDVTALKKEMSEFDEQIKEAKANHQRTLDLYASHKGFDSNGMVINNKDAEAFIREAIKSQEDTLKELRSASKQLRDFFKEARKLNREKVVVSGRGTSTLVSDGQEG